VQRSTIGVGPALRRARAARGVTLEEASRDTRIRREFLMALEEEDFDRLLGDVYVRGSIRSYATYLGLPSDQMVQAYARFAAAPEGPPAPAGPPAPENPIDAPRRRDSHLLFVMIAATLLILAASFGIISSRASAPPPADLSTDTAGPVVVGAEIVALVAAQQPVVVIVTIDGATSKRFPLKPGESRSFEADRSLTIWLDHGASAHVMVNGDDEGFPGRPNRPWHETYSYGNVAPTPSPAA
jgi:Helix-turn-helix domain